MQFVARIFFCKLYAFVATTRMLNATPLRPSPPPHAQRCMFGISVTKARDHETQTSNIVWPEREVGGMGVLELRRRMRVSNPPPPTAQRPPTHWWRPLKATRQCVGDMDERRWLAVVGAYVNEPRMCAICVYVCVCVRV